MGPYAELLLNVAFADEVLKEVLELGAHYGDWDYGQVTKVVIDMFTKHRETNVTWDIYVQHASGTRFATLRKWLGEPPVSTT